MGSTYVFQARVWMKIGRMHLLTRALLEVLSGA
jgi:hypothetical protein